MFGLIEPSQHVARCSLANAAVSAGELDRIAHCRTGAVRLDHRDRVGRDAGNRERFPHDVGVTVDAGREIADLAMAVVVDRGAADHREHRISIAPRVRQPAQRDHADTAGEYGPARLGVERATPTVGSENLSLVVLVADTVGHFDGDPTGERNVALHAEQALHGEVNGNERRRTRSLHVDARAAQIESIRHPGCQEVFVVRGVA